MRIKEASARINSGRSVWIRISYNTSKAVCWALLQLRLGNQTTLLLTAIGPFANLATIAILYFYLAETSLGMLFTLQAIAIVLGEVVSAGGFEAILRTGACNRARAADKCLQFSVITIFASTMLIALAFITSQTIPQLEYLGLLVMLIGTVDLLMTRLFFFQEAYILVLFGAATAAAHRALLSLVRLLAVLIVFAVLENPTLETIYLGLLAVLGTILILTIPPRRWLKSSINRFAFPLDSFALSSWVLQSMRAVLAQADRILVGVLLSLSAAAAYGLLVRILAFFVLLPQVIARENVLKLYRRTAQNAQSKIIISAFKSNSIQLSSALFGFWIFATAFIILDSGAVSGEPLIAVLLLSSSIPLTLLSSLLGDAAAARGQQSLRIAGVAIAAVLGIVLQLALIPTYGLVGAASVFALAHCIQCAVLIAPLLHEPNK